MIDLEIRKISRCGGLISAHSQKGRMALEKWLDVDFVKEYMTAYGRAYDFCMEQELIGLKVEFK